MMGCSTIKSSEQVKSVKSEQQLSEAVLKGSQLLATLQDKDYEAFCKLSSPAMKQEVTESLFNLAHQEMLEEFGEIKDFAFLTNLITPEVDNMVWVVTFTSTGSEGQEITKQLLFRVVAAELDGKCEIFSFGFF